MQRRQFLIKAGAALAALGLPAPALLAAPAITRLRRLGRPEPFDYARLKGMARALAARPYETRKRTLPAPVEALDWDRYQSIRYRQDHALWADQPGRFQARFFHLGLYFHSPVRMFDVVDGQAQELAYDGAAFDYGNSGIHGVTAFFQNLHTRLGSQLIRRRNHTILSKNIFRRLCKSR